MDLHEVQAHLNEWLEQAAVAFQKVPGSAVLVRYVRSSYQNDPVRSAIELVLFIFFIRYLLSPSYSTSKQNYVKLTEDASLSSFVLCFLAIGDGGQREANGWFVDRKSTSWSMSGRPSRSCRLRLLRRRPRWKSSLSSLGKKT